MPLISTALQFRHPSMRHSILSGADYCCHLLTGAEITFQGLRHSVTPGADSPCHLWAANEECWTRLGKAWLEALFAGAIYVRLWDLCSNGECPSVVISAVSWCTRFFSPGCLIYWQNLKYVGIKTFFNNIVRTGKFNVLMLNAKCCSNGGWEP